MIPPKSAEAPPEDKADGTLSPADTSGVGFPSLAGKPRDFDSSDSSVKKEVGIKGAFLSRSLKVKEFEPKMLETKHGYGSTKDEVCVYCECIYIKHTRRIYNISDVGSLRLV